MRYQALEAEKGFNRLGAVKSRRITKEDDPSAVTKKEG
jgi:hypothetical protein